MFADSLKSLQLASTTEAEVEALKGLKLQLQPGANAKSAWIDDESLEREWLQHASNTSFDDDNPFPGKNPESLFSCQDTFNSFTSYIFERRFGWSETVSNGKTVKVQRLGSDGMTSKDEGKYKVVLIELLDDFIKWYLYQKMSASMLESLQFTIVQATNKPVVRNQTIVHIMEWLKKNIELLKDEQFDLVKHLILLGLTDVWSAIRNACVSRLSPVIEHFSITQIESFFNDLVTICQKGDVNWQAQEGAVMGMNSVIRRFQWIGITPEELFPSHLKSASKTEYFLKFGREELQKLPEFITSKMQSVIFPLLANPQLSIRESATKAFSSYQSRCDFQDALASFRHVIKLLCKGTEHSPDKSDGETNLPHLAVLSPDYQFLDAYAAEGLLGICVFLVKHIPPGFLLPNWPLYFSTFSLYLMHPASTVRQATSSIFKFLVAKDSNNPVLLKLILQGLCSQWQPDMHLLTHPCDINKNDADTRPCCKGMKDLRHTMMMSKQNEKACPKGHRHSVTSLSEENEELLADCWEWREGRLLAYELILQFLIKNHWLYTFGPSNFTFPNYPPKVGGSVDECSMMHARQDRNRNLKKTSSYGGSTLKHILNSPRETAYGVITPVESEITEVPEDSVGMRARLNSLDSSTKKEPKPRSHSHIHGSQSEAIIRHSPESEGPTKMNRTVTIDPASYQSQSLHTLVRHYSYYAQPKTPYKSPMTNLSTKAASLLHLVKAVDTAQKKDTSDVNLSVSRDMRAVSPAQEVLRSCLCPSPLNIKNSNEEFTDPPWLETLHLESLSSILQTMLYQTIECLADSRWELRRMAQQVLPCLVEVIRWFNMKVLEDLWDSHLTQNTTLLCYGACIAFKYSVSHAAKLLPLLSDPPTSWQNPEMCKREVSRITNIMAQQLTRRLECVNHLIQRHCLDRMSIVSLEILILAHSHFNVSAEQKLREIQSITNFCHQLFVLAHGDEKLACDMANVTANSHFTMPNDGFLSCCHKFDKTADCSKQIEKTILNEIHSIIPVFIKNNKPYLTVNMLPLLVWYLGRDFDDDHLNRNIYESAYLLVAKLNEMKGNISAEHWQMVIKQCTMATEQLAEIVTQKDLDHHNARQVLDIYLMLCPLLPDPQHLKAIFQAVYTRTNTVSITKSSPLSQSSRHDNLAILSNDIPQSPVIGLESDTDSDSEEKALGSSKDLMLQESLTLNASNNSGSGPSGRHSAMSGSTDGRVVSPGSQTSDMGSDWDSWSEEEEDQTAATVIFTDFLKKLKGCYTSIGRTSEFTSEIQRLGDKERRVIKSILDSR